MKMKIRLSAMRLLGLALLSPCAMAETLNGDGISVSVEVDGDVVQTDVRFVVAATPQQVWAVLVDFDHMAQFMSSLTSSHVLSHSGNALRVAQSGKASLGPLSYAFDTVRDIELAPFEQIQSHQLSGNMKKLNGTTWLSAEGDKTGIHYHAEAISDTWIPPIAGKHFIAGETLTQFSEMRQEILRRKQLADQPAN